MALVRWITEMGMGVDVHGHDYTKAARRAVSDALRHSSLNFFNAAGKSRDDMHVEVRVAVAKPAEVDTAAVAEEVPYGTVIVNVVAGGLDVPAQSTGAGHSGAGSSGAGHSGAGHSGAGHSGDGIVIANAAILVSFPEQ